MENERIILEEKGHIVHVKLNRPEKKNAFDRAMFVAFSEAVSIVRNLSEARVVVLSGEGTAFSAGIDLAMLKEAEPFKGLADRSHGNANLFQQAAWGWRILELPVIAAVHGVAFGAGLQVALGADMRIIAPDTRLAIREAYWGLVPDMAGTALLRNLVRDDVARELTFTAREFSGEEALQLGLATRLHSDPLESAFALAAEIAKINPSATRATKRLLNLAADTNADDQLIAEAAEQQALVQQHP